MYSIEKIKFLVVFLFLVSIKSASPESGALKGNVSQQNELEEMRVQIHEFEKQLAKKKKKEESVLTLISTLDQEIDATNSYLLSINKDVRLRGKQIRKLNKEIEVTSAEVVALGELLKKRLVTFYKYGRTRFYEVLLSSKSFTQLAAWMHYKKIIAENDRRNYQSILKKKQTLVQTKEMLQIQLAEQDEKQNELKKEKRQLVKSRKKRESYLTDIRNDQKVISQRLKDIREAEKQILAFITRAEETRLTKDLKRPSRKTEKPVEQKRTYKFSQLKGKLEWPTSGPVISHFGRQKHPRLKTITENLGIEIKATYGSPVKTVDEGIVQTITWQRGRGNIIIISHDDGYYTVYTHLAEIHVDTQEIVKAGQVIGTVGDSGSLNGPILHFQIWKNTKNLNPEDWLA